MSPLPMAGSDVQGPMSPSDPHDRALVRHMLTLTPAERLRNLSNYWPLIRVGLEQRQLAGVLRS